MLRVARQPWWLLSALLGACLLVACSNTSAAPDRPEPDIQHGAKRDLLLSTTTSTRDSGLLDELIPRFERQTGYRVKPIAVGSGAALALGQRGEVDVVLAHAPEDERRFVASGAGINRQLVMYNDFVVVGPPGDPAGVAGATDVLEALRRIASGGNGFISRGDDSGTHQLERQLWRDAGIAPDAQDWYVRSGSGMGQTLRIADQRRAYTISDRGTYQAFKDRVELQILLERDARLLNAYHVIAVNQERFPKANAAGARALIDFLLAPETQRLIGEFGHERYGQPLFTPCARNSCGLEDEAGRQQATSASVPSACHHCSLRAGRLMPHATRLTWT